MRGRGRGICVETPCLRRCLPSQKVHLEPLSDGAVTLAGWAAACVGGGGGRGGGGGGVGRCEICERWVTLGKPYKN
jgi:hypothetical protein